MDDVKSKMSNGRQKSKGIYQIQTNKMDCYKVLAFMLFILKTFFDKRVIDILNQVCDLPLQNTFLKTQYQPTLHQHSKTRIEQKKCHPHTYSLLCLYIYIYMYARAYMYISDCQAVIKFARHPLPSKISAIKRKINKYRTTTTQLKKYYKYISLV